MIEAESLVNSRPLTYVAVEAKTSEALTPNHLLRMSRKIAYSPGEFEKAEYSKKIWRYSQQLTNEFWKRFVREYLPEITTRTKWYQDQRPIQVGGLVIIVDDLAPRNSWERGVVDVLYPGPDGKSRTAKVRTAKTVLKRPVAK
jgi:hypothetical protein